MAGFLLYMRVTRQPLNMEKAKFPELKLKHKKLPIIIYRELDQQLLLKNYIKLIHRVSMVDDN